MMNKLFCPERVFLFLGVLFGVMIMIFTPPFLYPDENAHFYRSLGILDGQIVVQKPDEEHSGSFLPKSIHDFENRTKFYDFLADRDCLKEKISFKDISEASSYTKNGEKIFINHINTALYSPVAYMPQVTGMKFMEMFTPSLLYIMFGGKIFNFLFYLILGFFAIRSLPFLKWVGVLILLAPINLSLAGSLSTDPVLLSSSMLFFAKILQYSVGDDSKIGWKQVVLLAVLAFIIGQVKQNFLIVFFVFLIPKKKFCGGYFVKMATVVVPSVVLSLVWGKIASSVLVPGNGAKPVEQAVYILSHPIEYLQTFFRTSRIFSRMLREMVGVLGWLNIRLDWWAYGLYYIFFVLNVFFSIDVESKGREMFSLKQKLIILSLSLLIIFVVSTNMYIVWSHVGADLIDGIQGRYFASVLLPAAAFFSIMLPARKSCFLIQGSTILFLIILLSDTVYRLYSSFFV